MDELKGAQPVGGAKHLLHGWQAVFVTDEDSFCRNCEHTIPAGKPFTAGALGKYCRDCLQAQGWRLSVVSLLTQRQEDKHGEV